MVVGLRWVLHCGECASTGVCSLWATYIDNHVGIPVRTDTLAQVLGVNSHWAVIVVAHASDAAVVVPRDLDFFP